MNLLRIALATIISGAAVTAGHKATGLWVLPFVAVAAAAWLLLDRGPP